MTGKTPIVAVTCTYTAYVPADEQHRIAGMDLSEVIDECESGTWLGGQTDRTVSQPITDEQEIEDRLLQIGNDGTFFDKTDE